jgi:hypothetical protein
MAADAVASRFSERALYFDYGESIARRAIKAGGFGSLKPGDIW